MKAKRFFAAILAACLALALALPCAAAPAETVSLEEAVQVVTALGIMSGDSSGNLGLDRRVSRAEFITMAIRATPDGDGVGQAATSPYPDVPRSHWASGYVEAGVKRGLISGYSDGTFRPGQEIRTAEGAAIVLALLGYGPDDFSGAYPTGQMSMYQSLKLDRGVSAAGAADFLTRRDAVYLFYNLMSARTREGSAYIQSLGYSLDASGKPDLLALMNGEMEGPIVAQKGWKSSLSFTPSRVYRNNSVASLASIQDYDIVYWNASMGTVWAYAKKATGPIQAIEPSSANPASVTVAGRTYDLESSAASLALSDLGQYRVGSTVTLLLGRGGGVAAVTSASASAGEQVGVVLSSVKGTHPDGNGGVYTAQTVTVLATDGQTYTYEAANSHRVGSLVRAAVSVQSGEVTLQGVSSPSLSGQVDRKGTKLDRYTFAENAQILDVADGRGVTIYPSRLAGLRLDSKQVRYYALNPMGELEKLILSDVTGDAGQYGVLTSFEEQGEGMYTSYSYEFDLGGASYAIPGTSTRFPVSNGPIQITGDPSSPDRLRPLTSAGTGELSNGQFSSGGQRYTLADSVAVYELRSGKYYLSTLARAEQSGGRLSAWYDKAESSGGRIRVIIVRE
ncbi:MAG: S-layer homology domain-containing protein [Lawsonibacter sp.]|nr:S-layer homology domain-containing protein [Lawsonibacter sp.]